MTEEVWVCWLDPVIQKKYVQERAKSYSILTENIRFFRGCGPIVKIQSVKELLSRFNQRKNLLCKMYVRIMSSTFPLLRLRI